MQGSGGSGGMSCVKRRFDLLRSTQTHAGCPGMALDGDPGVRQRGVIEGSGQQRLYARSPGRQATFAGGVSHG